MPNTIRGTFAYVACCEIYDSSAQHSIIIINTTTGQIRSSNSVDRAYAIGHGIGFTVTIV